VIQDSRFKIPKKFSINLGSLDLDLTTFTTLTTKVVRARGSKIYRKTFSGILNLESWIPWPLQLFVVRVAKVVRSR
jgi:hypothetical protein